jgi:hypothetical protein
MATTNNSWMPANGRHSVNIGSSLGRALKARKGAPATKASKIPDRDFYSFRYNFKPPSIDSTKPGNIDVKRGKDSTSVTVEHSSSQPGEGHVFVGYEQLAKEMDCVLIYDEETGTFSLEKLDSYMILTYERKTASTLNRPSASASPLPPPPPAPPVSQAPFTDLDLEAQLERDLLGLEEDAEGEPDDEFEEILPKAPPPPPLPKEEEEEDEEDIFIPPPRVPSPPKTKPPRPTKQLPKPPKPPAKPRAAPGKGKGKAKREAAPHVSDAEEEDLEFGQPAKRARPAPPSEGLALPGSSATVRDPSTIAPPYPSPAKAVPAVAAPIPPASDSEEDWDEVPAAPAPSNHIVMEVVEDEEEIDMNAFEAEMNLHLEESDEDFLAAAVSPEPDPNASAPRVNQFPAGDASQDEDDYSSSDDSDDADD